MDASDCEAYIKPTVDPQFLPHREYYVPTLLDSTFLPRTERRHSCTALQTFLTEVGLHLTPCFCRSLRLPGRERLSILRGCLPGDIFANRWRLQMRD